METKELKIQIPEGYVIDKENSTFEKIVFKKKENTKPRSWEEYCSNFKGCYYYIQDNRDNIASSFTPNGFISSYKNILPSKELAEAFLAMMQLVSLRHDWINKWSIDRGMSDDWEPDWSNVKNWCIAYCLNEINVLQYSSISQSLSFPTKEMATDFVNCFKDLLEIAKPLI